MRIPDNFGQNKLTKDIHERVNETWREGLADADRYEATEARGGVVYVDGKDYLYLFHNGIPMRSSGEIAQYAVSCYSSGDEGEGDSLNGCGLSYCASILHRHMHLMVASVVDGKVFAAEAFGIRDDRNRWNINECPGKAETWFNSIFGPDSGKFKKEYSVFYFWRIDVTGFINKKPSSEWTRSFLGGRLEENPEPGSSGKVNHDLMFSTDVLERVRFEYSEIEHGYPEYELVNHEPYTKKSFQYIPFKMGEKASGEGQGRHEKTIMIPGSLYKDRFLAKLPNGEVARFSLPFLAEVRSKPELKMECEGEWSLLVFSGELGESHDYLTNQRDIDVPGHVYEKGKTSFAALPSTNKGNP